MTIGIPPATIHAIVKIARENPSRKYGSSHILMYFREQAWPIYHHKSFDFVTRDSNGHWLLIDFWTKNDFTGSFVNPAFIENMDMDIKKFIDERKLDKSNVHAILFTDSDLNEIATNYLYNKDCSKIGVKFIDSGPGIDITKVTPGGKIDPVKGQENEVKDGKKANDKSQSQAESNRVNKPDKRKVTSQSNVNTRPGSVSDASYQSKIQILNVIPPFLKKKGKTLTKQNIIEFYTKRPRMNQHELLLYLFETEEEVRKNKKMLSYLTNWLVSKGYIREQKKAMKSKGKPGKYYEANRAYFEWGLYFDEPQQEPLDFKPDNIHYRPVCFAPSGDCRDIHVNFHNSLDLTNEPENISKRYYPDENHPDPEIDALLDGPAWIFLTGIKFWPRISHPASEEDDQEQFDAKVNAILTRIQEVERKDFNKACTYVEVESLGESKDGKPKPKPNPHVVAPPDMFPPQGAIIEMDGQRVSFPPAKSPDDEPGSTESKDKKAGPVLYKIDKLAKRVEGVEKDNKETKKDINQAKEDIGDIKENVEKVPKAIDDLRKEIGDLRRDVGEKIDENTNANREMVSILRKLLPKETAQQGESSPVPEGQYT